MELIEREALIDEFEYYISEAGWGDEWNRVTEEVALESVKNAPAIDAEPVVHSRWLGSPLDGYYCKNCLELCLYNFYEEQVLSKYCPRCGARMDGDEE